ncbi:MAG: outer membrane beta-barrel protein [Gammaproteobacteria bacterium]|nr:outer membrane beta-barrel protein [Gammaproteobacteria bacterium]
MKTHKLLLLAVGLLALVAAPALANEPGTWILRGGIGTVQPDSDNLTFSDAGDTVTIDVDNGTSMTMSATYMFTEHWAFDVLASWPFKHDINASTDVPDVGIETARIGETKHLPPTLSFQYHFTPDAVFQPYVGLGVNWTTFFGTELVSELADEGINDLKLDDSIGIAAQIGGDWSISDNWVMNLDVRYIDIETEAKLVGPAFEGEATIGDITIDPWVYALNLGYRF